MITTTSRYAIAALVALAKEDIDGAYVSIQRLSERAHVPKPYLAKILKVLAKSPILESKKGINGGVRLAKERVSFMEVCQAFNDPIIQQTCLVSRGTCDPDDPCPFHSAWSLHRQKIITFLQSQCVSKGMNGVVFLTGEQSVPEKYNGPTTASSNPIEAFDPM